MAKIERITHVSFRCNKFEDTLRFYRDTLGLPHAFTLRNEDGSVWISYLQVAPRQFIELFNETYSGDNDWTARGHHHVCLIVKDIEEAARALEDKGVKLTRGPVVDNPPYRIPYAVNHTRGKCHSYGFFIQDPEGNEIEIMQYTKDSLQVVNDHP